MVLGGSSDLAALGELGGASPESGGRGVKRGNVAGEESEKKRECLRHYDLPPAQLLNSMGMSGIEKIPTEKLWELCKKGNAKVQAFSNLCFESRDRRNVGLSQGCEVVFKAIERLETCAEMAIVIKPEVLAKAKEEAAALKPQLALLNQGKTNRNGLSSIRNVAYYIADATAPDAAGVKEAAEAVHAWLTAGKSVLRSLLVLFSSGGVFYTAHCHEKTMRAFVEHGGGDKESFVGAALARPSQPGASTGEMGGLAELGA
jgi:hypothetical protein